MSKEYSYLYTVRCIPKTDCGRGKASRFYSKKDTVTHTNWEYYVRTGLGYFCSSFLSWANGCEWVFSGRDTFLLKFQKTSILESHITLRTNLLRTLATMGKSFERRRRLLRRWCAIFFSARRKVVLLSISSWERERPEKLAQERDEDSLGTHNHRNSEVCMLGRTCTRMQRY